MYTTDTYELLKLSIFDFYNFITSTKDYTKHSIAEIKGIYYNKFIQRMKSAEICTNIWEFKRSFGVDNIIISIKEGKIEKLEFKILNEYNSYQKNFISLVQKEMDKIDLNDIYNQYFSNYQGFTPQVEQIINKLNNFKIPNYVSRN